jgi:hypothetical protein
MKKIIQNLLLTVAVLAGFNLQVSTAFAQGTAFAYQGRLNSAGTPASGTYDFTFTLFATNSAGIQTGATLTNFATAVSNGLFDVTLDFGENFPGAARWLEIGVRTNDAVSFSTLSPRQPILAVPYAIMAGSASNLLGNLPTAQISGMVPLLQLPSELLTNSANNVSLAGDFNGSFNGYGYFLNSLNPDSLISGGAGAQLQLTNFNNSFNGNFNGSFNGYGYFLNSLNPDSLISGGAGAQLQLTNFNNSFNGNFNGSFSGYGYFLNSLNPDSLISGGAGAQLQLTNFNNSFNGNFNGSFNGCGYFLNNLNPDSLISGGAGAQLQLTNFNNSFNGNFNGSFNGYGYFLNNLNPDSLISGGAGAQLQLTNLNNSFNGNFNGSFSGYGGGLTQISVDAVQGGITINLPVLVPGGGTNILCFTNGILRAIQ